MSMHFPETLIQHIWQYKLFDTSNLKSTDGQSIEIIKVGEANANAGPDFTNARVKINTIELVGNLEIHLLTSDFEKHKHNQDKAYNNLILHVVYEHDNGVQTQNSVATLELKNYIYLNVIANYNRLAKSKSDIACAGSIKHVDSIVWSSYFEALVVERLENKIEAIKKLLAKNNSNWEETFYQLFAKALGYKINELPFELLAQSLPQHILAKNKDKPLAIESLLFGQAGFLAEVDGDEYYRQLQQEYQFQKHKYELTGLDKSVWKFLRLRPANFPTVRIGQLANIITHSSHLFSKVVEANKVEEIYKLLSVEPSIYWLNHYQFNKPSTVKIKSLGKSTIDVIIINTIIPTLFAYADYTGQEEYKDKAFNWLENIKAEKNAIIEKYLDLGLKNVKSALQSQALLQLHNNYCATKSCLQCRVGNFLLKNTESKA